MHSTYHLRLRINTKSSKVPRPGGRYAQHLYIKGSNNSSSKSISLACKTLKVQVERNAQYIFLLLEVGAQAIDYSQALAGRHPHHLHEEQGVKNWQATTQNSLASYVTASPCTRTPPSLTRSSNYSESCKVSDSWWLQRLSNKMKYGLGPRSKREPGNEMVATKSWDAFHTFFNQQISHYNQQNTCTRG